MSPLIRWADWRKTENRMIWDTHIRQLTGCSAIFVKEGTIREITSFLKSSVVIRHWSQMTAERVRGHRSHLPFLPECRRHWPSGPAVNHCGGWLLLRNYYQRCMWPSSSGVWRVGVVVFFGYVVSNSWKMLSVAMVVRIMTAIMIVLLTIINCRINYYCYKQLLIVIIDKQT